MILAPLTIANLFSGTKIKAINNHHNILHSKQHKELLHFLHRHCQVFVLVCDIILIYVVYLPKIVVMTRQLVTNLSPYL